MNASDRTESKFEMMRRFAHDLQELSCCKVKKCGAVSFPHDFSCVHAIGYNGPPIGKPNNACRGSGDNEELARCGCGHAEANLVAKGGRDILYCTTMPCEHCAIQIVNSRRFYAVIWDEPYWNSLGLDVLLHAPSMFVMGDKSGRQWTLKDIIDVGRIKYA
jgi:deoxycytidylate deaminase